MFDFIPKWVVSDGGSVYSVGVQGLSDGQKCALLRRKRLKSFRWKRSGGFTRMEEVSHSVKYAGHLMNLLSLELTWKWKTTCL